MNSHDSLTNEILGLYSISSDYKITRLYSRINNVYLVKTKTGEFVLKEYLKLSERKVITLHKIQEILKNKKIFIPEIIPNKRGQKITIISDRIFELSKYINHIDIPQESNINLNLIKLAGKTLGKLHKALKDDEISNLLEPYDFTNVTKQTSSYIEEFKIKLDSIYEVADDKRKKQLILLKEIIFKTESFRSNGTEPFNSFLNQQYVPTHGDFSSLNALFTKNNQVFVIDWDNIKLRPLTWDLQAGISLFCCKYDGNAYIVEPDFKRIKVFLKAYLSENTLPHEQILLLSEVVKYNFAIYWLSYTLPAVLNNKFVLLDLIPSELQHALFWTTHISDYQDLISNY